MLAELVRRLRVDDVHAVDALARRLAVESIVVRIDVDGDVQIRLIGDAREAAERMALKRIHRIVVRRRSNTEPRRDAEPADDLDDADDVEVAPDGESLTDPRLMTTTARQLEITLPRRVQADAVEQERLAPSLDIVVPALHEVIRMHALQPEPAAAFRIEAHVAERPEGREAGPVVEGRIHLEAAIVVLELIRE